MVNLGMSNLKCSGDSYSLLLHDLWWKFPFRELGPKPSEPRAARMGRKNSPRRLLRGTVSKASALCSPGSRILPTGATAS